MIAIECSRVSKRFDAAQVVDQVSLTIEAGSVHSIVGANGAGKSTLLGMMSGRLAPTEGEVMAFGVPLRGADPRQAIRAGVTAVYQELSILPALSAAANVFLGQERTAIGFLNERQMSRRFVEISDQLGVDLHPETRAGDLTVASLQMLEIMRAVQADARIILFDEPTAPLSDRERRSFFALTDRLRRRGTTIVLVTHNLSEVLAASDTVTVMRDGQKVDEGPVQRWDKSSLVHAMTGDLPTIDQVPRASRRGAEVVFAANNLTVPGVLDDITITARAGEIIGLAGLVGAGRSTILRSLAGAVRGARGTVRLGDGVERQLPRSVRVAIRRYGHALVPEERKTEGLILGMTVPDNCTVTDLRRVTSFAMVRSRLQLAAAAGLLGRLRLSRPVAAYPVRELSGGNQQKVVLAKWIFRGSRVLLVDEPTRGVDVAAKADLFLELRRLADEGTTVIFTSSEIEEVLDVSDRVYVVANGAIRAELDMHTDHPTVRTVLDIAFGVEHGD